MGRRPLTHTARDPPKTCRTLSDYCRLCTRNRIRTNPPLEATRPLGHFGRRRRRCRRHRREFVVSVASARGAVEFSDPVLSNSNARVVSCKCRSFRCRRRASKTPSVLPSKEHATTEHIVYVRVYLLLEVCVCVHNANCEPKT